MPPSRRIAIEWASERESEDCKTRHGFFESRARLGGGEDKKMCERVRVRDAAQVGFKRRVVWYDDVCTKIVQIHKKNEHTLWMADGWTDDSRTG